MKIYITGAKRTPVGSLNGAFSESTAAKLGAEAIKAALMHSGLQGASVDEVIVGHVVSAGQGMNVGRQAALAAGLPDSVPAYTVNMVCGSGMKAVMDACAHIKAGDADIVIAAGTECMSQIPFALPGKMRRGIKMGDTKMYDLLLHDGLTDAFHNYHMGVTAENIANMYNISRQQQDEFAYDSQMKARKAIASSRFNDEIVPVDVMERGKVRSIVADEFPKPDISLEKLSSLSPVFLPEGTVTAGNASGINDGASAIVVASESAVKKYGLTPLVEIESYHQAGIAPEIMGLGPVEATMGALKKASLHLIDIDLIECNEAFAGQALGVICELSKISGTPIDVIHECTNVNGGAVALGHPLGASGNRIIVTLLYEMQRQKSERGLATLCVGGGMGTAIILKRA